MSLFSLITGSYLSKDYARGVFEESEPYEKDFSKYYEENLKPLANEFEKFRIHSLMKASKRIRIAVPVAILVFVLSILLIKDDATSEDMIENVVVMSIIIYGVLIAWVYQSINIYTSSIKSEIFPIIMAFLGPYQYYTGSVSMVKKFDNSQIIPNYDYEHSEDLVTGTYKDVSINLFQTRLVEEIHFFQKSAITVFKGVFVSLSMNKKFNYNTIITKNMGKFVHMVNGKPSNLQNVELEDPKFSNIFEVFSGDQIEARYLLTTSFMERLIRLQEAFHGQSIKCSFFDNQLLMMISIKDGWFEAGSIYEAEDFVDDAKSLLKEMHMIFSIIDILKLNQNIGM